MSQSMLRDSIDKHLGMKPSPKPKRVEFETKVDRYFARLQQGVDVTKKLEELCGKTVRVTVEEIL